MYSYVLFSTLFICKICIVGERGINLSGGQKARVSLARAFMSAERSQIFLLDDPFSAVDGATGNWIFDHGVQGVLGDKIRIIALNSHLHLLRNFDRIVVLENGVIAADGSPQDLVRTEAELLQRVTGFSVDDLTKAYTGADAGGSSEMDGTGADAGVTAVFAATSTGGRSGMTPSASKSSLQAFINQEKQSGNGLNLPTTSTSASVSTSAGALGASGESKSVTAGQPLIAKETATAGSVGYATYVRYFSASLMPKNYFREQMFYEEDSLINLKSWCRFIYGSVLIAMVLLIFVVTQVARVGVDFVMLRWASSGEAQNSVLGKVYFILFGILLFSLVTRAKTLSYFAILSSKNIHLSVLRAVMSASVPLFFDTHTVGEVLNRFAKDCETLDMNIPEFLLQMLVNWLQVLSIFALCIFASSWFAILMVPLGYGFYSMFQYFSSVSRDLKKLEAISRSPIYVALSETLTGIDTIRAYGDTDRFLQTYFKKMEYHEKFFYHLWMSMSWVTARLELASTLVLVSVSLLTVSLRQSASPIALGLALSYSLQLTALFQRTVQLTIDVSTYMTSTERMCEYLAVPQEHSVARRGPKKASDAGFDIEAAAAVGGSGGGADITDAGVQLQMVEKASSPADNAGNTGTTGSSGSVSTASSVMKKWSPKHGTIEFNNVWLSYRGNPPVLRGVSFAVKHGERVGVCGRTGAGKVRC
jgi:ATP-binding cassette, subfamily C (CFTR/MRP), member 1